MTVAPSSPAALQQNAIDAGAPFPAVSPVNAPGRRLRRLQKELWSALAAALPGAGKGKGAEPGTVPHRLSLSFFRESAADVLLPHVLADRGYHFGRKGEQRMFSQFRFALVPGSWHRDRLHDTADVTRSLEAIHVVGSLRLDILRLRQQTHRRKRRGGHALTVLIAPGNGQWKNATGAELGLGAAGLAELKTLLGPHCDLRIAPHPTTTWHGAPVSADLLDADLVISDYSSVIYEAWGLGKPVVFPRWLIGDAITAHAPRAAEGHIMAERIGLHTDDPQALLQLIRQPPQAPDADVDSFMTGFVANYRGDTAATRIRSALLACARPRSAAVPDKKPSTRTSAKAQASEASEEPPVTAQLWSDLALQTRKKSWAALETTARELLRHEGPDPKVLGALATALNGQKKSWQEIITLETLLGQKSGEAGLWFRLGEAQEAMRAHGAAATCYRQAIGLNPKAPALWHYHLSYVLGTPGHDAPADPAGSRAAAAAAIAADTKLDAARFGIGIFHEARGYWQDAARAYAETALAGPADATLFYRAGYAHDRSYDWAGAEGFYSLALLETAGSGNWYFRLGFVRERQGNFAGAAEAYAEAIRCSDKHIAYWVYRLGYVLERAGEPAAACRAWLGLVAQPDIPPGVQLPWQEPEAGTPESGAPEAGPPGWRSTLAGSASALIGSARTARVHRSPEFLRNQARLVLEAAGDWAGAAAQYRAALERSNDHDPALYYALGRALTFAGDFPAACEAFRSSRILQRPHGLNEAKLNRNENRIRLNSYAEYLEVLPIRPRSILFESFNGSNLSCNPYALYRRIRELPRFADYSFVWTCDDPTDAPEDIRNDPKVALVRRESDLYLRYIASCEYLINNSGFPYYFIRREGQKYLATWHGTPLKTLGKKQKYKFFDHKRTQRNFLQSTHLISPNPHTTEVYLRDYDLRGLYDGRFGETGYPRIDRTLAISPGRRREILGQLGLSGEKPIVFYAPTWRGTLTDVAFDTERLAEEVRSFPENVDVIFRGHSLLEKLLAGADIGCTVVPKEIESNEVLAITDILITDYSSIFFDFIPRNKPIILYVYDMEEYEAERGLYFDIEEMPGLKLRSRDELVAALHDLAADPAPQLEGFEAAMARFCPHEDGQAADRTIAFFFDDAPETLVRHQDGRQNVLIHPGSFTPNGITTAFTNLHKALQNDPQLRLVTLFSPAGPETNPEQMTCFRRLDQDAAYVPRFGYAVESTEEGYLRQRQANIWSGPANDEEQQMLRRFHAREYQRMLGSSRTDGTFAYAGYDQFYQDVLAGAPAGTRKTVALHNNMYAEHVHRWPGLARVFPGYADFDALASVSEATHLLNQQQLTQHFGIDPAKFVPVDNLLSIRDVQARAAEPVPEAFAALFDTQAPLLITLGRLSVEKDHAKLLRAFAALGAAHQDARLLILGDGPLHEPLTRLIDELGLEGRAILGGHTDNPFPLLARADGFVLSSNHEGQPMVLFEALILGKPIVATDITGNRGVLEGRGGLLVENSAEGLTEGMQQLLTGAVAGGGFDADAYQAAALAQLRVLLLGTEPERAA